MLLRLTWWHANIVLKTNIRVNAQKLEPTTSFIAYEYSHIQKLRLHISWHRRTVDIYWHPPPHTHTLTDSQTEFLVDFTWNLTLAEQWRQQIWARPGARIWAPGPPLVVIFGSWARPSEDWINSNSCAVPLGLDWEIVRHTYHSCCQRPQCCSSRSGSLSKASGRQVDRCHTETRQSTWGSISKTSLIRQSGLYCCLKKDGGRYMKRLQLTGERAPGWHLHTHAGEEGKFGLETPKCFKTKKLFRKQRTTFFFKKKKTLCNILIITFLL